MLLDFWVSVFPIRCKGEEYGDSLYEAGRILYKQLQDSKDYISLFTTSDYVREVSNHLYEAYNLKRFVNSLY